MTRALEKLLKRSAKAVSTMTPEERAAMYDAQRKSWRRAFTTPCEHGALDFEQCADCRAGGKK